MQTITELPNRVRYTELMFLCWQTTGVLLALLSQESLCHYGASSEEKTYVKQGSDEAISSDNESEFNDTEAV